MLQHTNNNTRDLPRNDGYKIRVSLFERDNVLHAVAVADDDKKEEEGVVEEEEEELVLHAGDEEDDDDDDN